MAIREGRVSKKKSIALAMLRDAEGETPRTQRIRAAWRKVKLSKLPRETLDALECLIDRLSNTKPSMRFLGLSLNETVPDANTIWTFGEALTKARIDGKPAIDRFDGGVALELAFDGVVP